MMARGKRRNTPSPRAEGVGARGRRTAAVRGRPHPSPPPHPSRGGGCLHRPIPHRPVPHWPIPLSPPPTPRDRANAEQRAASDPAVSAFVAASAGSGKTKLLTDRLLRLMLAGAKPERIQCLTFTKAAAAEMAVRLQRTLGTGSPWPTRRWTTRCASSPSSPPPRPAPRAPARCSPACSTCRAACGSAPSTPSASRCCAASRWRPRSRRISGWSTNATPPTP